eukprot:TRINITY_DN22408_c0_g1_i1.p1 TRINITY_DN22408_c0_g1~~TRINITY_DN22408_c0_g1_i1.p1  ORF type:complete len:217 (-),score=64.02 TRINITY_DN22408_c0_g1_i1:63-713(-)
MSVPSLLMALRRLLHLSSDVLGNLTNLPPSLFTTRTAKDDIAGLWALAPGRALKVEAEATFLSKSLQLSQEQSMKQACRKGFETELTQLGSLKQRDTHGLDRVEAREGWVKEMMDQPISLRKKEEMVHALPLMSGTKLSMLHELRVAQDSRDEEQGKKPAEWRAACQPLEGNLVDSVRSGASVKASRRAAAAQNSRFAAKQEPKLTYVRGGQFYIP